MMFCESDYVYPLRAIFLQLSAFGRTRDPHPLNHDMAAGFVTASAMLL